MERTETVFWLRTVAYLTIIGVIASLVLQGSEHLAWVLGGIAVFAAALPMWPWARRLQPPVLFLILFAEALLITTGQYVSAKPGTVMVLFFVLIPCCIRLPRRFTLLCYTIFPFLACLPYLIGPDPRAGWSVIAGVVPGFAAIIVFSEGSAALRAALEAKQKLLDELIDAQRRQSEPAQMPTPSASPETIDSGPGSSFTRRDREVLSLVAMGFSNKEIAEKLFLAEGTVKNRVSQLLEKIGARDRTQAALRAREWGVL